MAADGALSKRQFFHGSPEHFESGDVIVPGSEIGKQTRGDSEPGKVYLSPHQFVAAQYTWAFDQHGKLAEGQDERAGGAGPHGHVYEVEPIGQLRKDKNAGGAHMPPGLSYTARQARVVRRLDRKEWYG